jgi:hypothetical protein
MIEHGPLALVALAIAIWGSSIAWGQWVTARSKLVLDLYEHRLKAYDAFRGPIGQAVRDGASDTINFLDYIVAENRAKFLFGHDVVTFLAKMRHALSQLGYASTMLKGDRLEGEELRKHLDIQRESMEQLANFWTRFDELALPYMRMAQKMPWVPSR